MRRLLVDQNDILQTRLDEVANPQPGPGEALLKLEHAALTANNVTYAASGFTIGYWKFFPSGVAGMGLLPVWGVAEVVESRSEHLEAGTRLYGFFPLAEGLTITPKPAGQGAVVDAAEHRADLPALYNRYVKVTGGAPAQDHLRALLQPLLATSYLLCDWLTDNDYFGASQIIIGSASSKTGLGLCRFLSEQQDRPYRIVGLTSARNRAFVEGLGACDQLLTYDAVTDLAQVPSVYVDMAGNGAVKAALHSHLRDHLKHSAAVGLSHWDKFQPKQQLEGIKPQFFFAPAQAAKRSQEWGPGEVEKRISQAWKRIASDSQDWMDVKRHDGIAAAPEVYDALATGSADPRDGHIIAF